MVINKYAIGLILTIASTICYAQIPRMDIQFKSGLSTSDDLRDKYNNQFVYDALVIQADLNWNISQYLAIGGYFTKGSKTTMNMFGEYGSGNPMYPFEQISYGGKIRISTGRQPLFRPFFEIGMGRLDMIMQKDNYQLSSSGKTITISVGLMIRVSHRVYVILPQVIAKLRSSSFYFEVPNNYAFNTQYTPFIETYGGLCYNLGKKK